MNLQEFKAWFEGFTEGLECRPNEKQWEKIKKRVEEIDGKEITERVYINTYYPPYYHNWIAPTFGRYTICNDGNVGGDSLGNMNYMNCADTSDQQLNYSVDNNFNSYNAMYTLGKNETYS